MIRLYSKREVNPLDIRSEQIDIQDIAHGLALCNRFAGQTSRPISVAQHSVYAARMIADALGPIQLIRQALLHDAAEAFLGDVTKWLKETSAMEYFRHVENRLQRVIYQKFSVPDEMHPMVEEVDRILVRFEGSHKYGFGPEFIIRHPAYGPLTKEEKERVGKWSPWSWRESERLFLDHFRMYFLD